MTDRMIGAVVVGVDGSQASAYALDWAADEAERLDVPMVIAHAGHVRDQDALQAQTQLAALRDACDFGKQLLADAVATVAMAHPHVTVETVLRETDPPSLLVELGANASMIVLGRTTDKTLARIVFGSTPLHVAHLATCPVLVIADGIVRSGASVVVGVSASETATQSIGFACLEATARGVGVRAIRCVSELPWAAAGWAFPGSTTLDMLREAEQAILDNAVAAARERFPDLEITGELHIAPVDATLSTIADAAIIVVGCRRPGAAHDTRLGPVTAWLIQGALSPVAVVGQLADRYVGRALCDTSTATVK